MSKDFFGRNTDVSEQESAVTEKDQRRVTSLRVDVRLLRKARFYLDEEGKNVGEFLVEQLQRYVESREQ